MRSDALILFGDVFSVGYDSQDSNKIWDDDTFFRLNTILILVGVYLMVKCSILNECQSAQSCPTL